jgi:1,4-dihydroxy-2-naphthoyl-CoA hydrolase
MPPIWFNPDITLKDIQPLGARTMGDHLGIEWAEIGENYLKASMPVDARTHQPFGLLHGGASCVLAETVGSVASFLIVNPELFRPVGLEINANHVRGVRSGRVTGTASPLHIGSMTHVWDIKIHDDAGHLICVSRLTVAIVSVSKLR